MTSAATQALPIPESPYPGIEPFRFMDQQIFAARNDEIWDLQSSITIYRAVLVYGDSGTGKSSLINAGLIPRILDEDYVPDRLRVQPRVGKEIKVERIRASAGDDALFLPSNFAKDETSANFEISIEALMSRLMEFKNAAPQRRAFERCPILLFDQFEEFITLFEEAQRGEHNQQAVEAAECQKKILDSLVTLIRDEELPIKILFVFREDYLAKLNILFEHCPKLLDQYLRLLPPHVEKLKQIIRAPFEKEELRSQFVKSGTGEGHSELTEELAEEIAAELAKRSEGKRVNLSELQIVCRKLWESADPVSLFKNEGIQGLLEQYMSAAVNKFPEDLRDPAVALLGHMVTSSNTRNIISQDDLINREKDDFSRERIERTLKSLIESKLVLREPRRNVYFYEIVSEFLVPWIKQQQVARQAFLERRKLEEETAEKLALANKQKRKLFYISLVIILFLVLGLIAAFLWRQYAESRRALQEARNDQLRAEIDRDEALKVTRVLDRLTNESPADRLAALEEADSLLDDKRVPKQIIVAILSIAASDIDPTVAARADELIKEASISHKELAQSLSDLAKSDVELADSLPPRFYIHIADESQVPRYNKLKSALEQEGYLVASYENVGVNATSINQLRYFRRDDEEKARRIATELLQTTDQGKEYKIVYIKGYEDSNRVRPGHFEIWIAGDKPKGGTIIINFAGEDAKEITKLSFVVTLVEKTTGQRIDKASGYIEVPPGSYTMTINAKGYEESKGEITLKAGDVLEMLNIRLRKKYAEQQ
jgi:predicted AAA+ superfamily ATPase